MIYRQAFNGIESEIHEFLTFLGSAPHSSIKKSNNVSTNLIFVGFEQNFTPCKSVSNQNSASEAGDGLVSCLILPLDFCWESISEAYHLVNDYQKLPNIEHWYSLETKVMKQSTT
jgi:hypothetical protein